MHILGQARLCAFLRAYLLCCAVHMFMYMWAGLCALFGDGGWSAVATLQLLLRQMHTHFTSHGCCRDVLLLWWR